MLCLRSGVMAKGLVWGVGTALPWWRFPELLTDSVNVCVSWEQVTNADS